jgi:hypothetical protein
VKISVQEKIAELERRILDLECEAELHWGFAPKNYHRSYRNERTVVIDKSLFGEHWDNMWREFHLVMKSFRRET